MTRIEEIEILERLETDLKIPEDIKEIMAYIICIEFNSMRRHSVNESKEVMQMNEYFQGLDR